MTRDQPPIAMTMGDPAGIGPELTIRVWEQASIGGTPFFVLAAPEILASAARRLGSDLRVIETDLAGAADAFASGLPVVPLENPVAGEPGRPGAQSAAATIESITRAVEAVRLGQARAIVTNPIAKSVLYASGFSFPGHTEFLGELASKWAPRLSRS